MYSFNNDYSEGCHPNILKALIDSNFEQCEGYGLDPHCENAINILKKHIGNENAAIHFLAGGTITNMTVISSFLRPHEAVMASNTGHVNVHETGAIESTGHKVLVATSDDGKLNPSLINGILEEHNNEHMVKPRLVYISNSTELGTVYTKRELSELHEYCSYKGLLLFLDGARLGHALCSTNNDLTMEDIAKLTDAFYIGGTKNGALLGEALVINNEFLRQDFRYFIKQKGAMLAKGRILGIQFEQLFTSNLYYELARHADEMAQLLRGGIANLGYGFASDSTTNQIFPILPNELIVKLKENYIFSTEYKVGHDLSCIRLVTSWATREDAVTDFLKEMYKYSI